MKRVHGRCRNSPAPRGWAAHCAPKGMAPTRVAASAMLQRLRAAVAVGRPRNAFRDRAWRSLAWAGHKARSTCRSADCDSISGQMVERIVAIGVTRVRFPADALFLALRGPSFLVASCQSQHEGSACPALEGHASQDASSWAQRGSLARLWQPATPVLCKGCLLILQVASRA